eukprot:CAMPEP_0170577670 /NCGR_PEP_ID=MMETSP0224-20130122/5053_1 /TAXON_ID=285029 /ORGANISM="Togula jolla, Strain CCCM 725" /LENGTH=307 /DNA_ID=CAMNT_0010900601 /DNA_START=31 /DNA_END=954 /DNA_ORIENTATION=-
MAVVGRSSMPSMRYPNFHSGCPRSGAKNVRFSMVDANNKNDDCIQQSPSKHSDALVHFNAFFDEKSENIPKYSVNVDRSVLRLQSLVGQNLPEPKRSLEVPVEDDATEYYNNLIRQCLRVGRVQEAEALFVNMEQNGVMPNVLSYNLVINSYATTGDAARAAHLLDSMLDHNIAPNEVTYATICKVLAFNGQVEHIQNFLRLLKKSNMELNVYFFGALISACGRCLPRDVKTAVRAFNEMVALGLRPQSVKKALARAVGVGRASAMISQACHSTSAVQRWHENEKALNEKDTLYQDLMSPVLVRISL